MSTYQFRQTALVGTLALTSALLACSGEDATSFRNTNALEAGGPDGNASRVGSVALALSSNGVALSSLRFRVEDASGQIVFADTLDVESPSETLSLEFDAPAGADYLITLSAEAGAGVSCTGSARFTVARDTTTDVSVALVCEASGLVTVVGNIIPPSRCPAVSLPAPSEPVVVGDTVQLSASAGMAEGTTYAWASSGGTLSNSRSAAATFSCTEAGPVTLTLTVSDGECADVASVELECLPAAGGACSGLGSTCHVVDPGSGPLHECHELGHGGDEVACSAQRTACVDACGAALCQTLGSLCHEVDPGSGPLHECHELGHAGDATACFERGRECFDLCTEARANLREPVTLAFAASVGGEPFACGTTYEGVGATSATAQPLDFRFYVSDVRLIAADGAEEPVVIDERSPWQLPGVALLDFADAEGLCSAGTAATNLTVTGRVLPGDYVGVAFRVGVPEAQNHADPATLPAPLELGTMSWGWLLGYKFLVAEMAQVGDDATGLGLLHLGSTACTGNPQAGTVVCSKPNRSDIRLNAFDAATDTIVADIGALFADTDLGAEALCHSGGDFCAAPFERAGLDFATGLSTPTQTLFRVE